MPRNVRLLNSLVNMNERAHKKNLKYAIEQSKGEIIITTDTNCKHNNKWLDKMVSYFDESIAFLSGPVQFESNRNLFEEI